MGIELEPYQQEAIKKLRPGSILCGGVGSGKSRTSLAYYYICQGGKLDQQEVKPLNAKDLYIITTARKRDTHDWEPELNLFGLSVYPDKNVHDNKVTVDSWNNVVKYQFVPNAFFIFDEQRVVGSGPWVKAFLKIAKNNHWILLSATPGDCWMDYVPVFIANGFYRNRTEFITKHVVYSRYSKYPSVDKYLHEEHLHRLKKRLLVDMDYHKRTVSHEVDEIVGFDKDLYKSTLKTRWNPFADRPIRNSSELCSVLRRITNADPSRIERVKSIVSALDKVIIFYNFNYELEILKNIDYGEDYTIAEWNGHKHEAIPSTKRWVYLVQYTSGAEGWNCVETNTIVFYSQTYAYKTRVQAAGRIDRLNTPFTDLYFYHLRSTSSIDLAIHRALSRKETFNETTFVDEALA